jgi:gamma-glutamyltranspeptidase / glutathione hydrolase
LLHHYVRKLLSARQWRGVQKAVTFGIIAGLSGCVGNEVPLGTIGNVDGPLGGAVADEPRATIIAQDVLSAGGSAADAATAIYFTMAVTYPVAASLGGGGECVIFDPKEGHFDNIVFPNISPKNGGEIAVPGNMRGIAALHARYGKLPWSQLLAPAEQMANFGQKMSRALHSAMAASSSKVNYGPGLSKIFIRPDGMIKHEGEKFLQRKLASLISVLRSEGGAAFYNGQLARNFVEEANDAGGNLTSEDLWSYKPSWSTPITYKTGDHTVAVSNSASGRRFQKIWTSLFEGRGLLRISEDFEAVEIADKSGIGFSDLTTSDLFLSNSYASFVTSDDQGQGVACVVGVGRPFGTGEISRISGIAMAPNLPDSQKEIPVSPMVVGNSFVKELFYVSGATGGAAGTTASILTALGIFASDKDLDTSMAKKRIFATSVNQPLLYETGLSDIDIKSLEKKYPVAVEVDRLGIVNAISCPEGKVYNCVSRADPRGSGLAIIENR